MSLKGLLESTSSKGTDHEENLQLLAGFPFVPDRRDPVHISYPNPDELFMGGSNAIEMKLACG